MDFNDFEIYLAEVSSPVLWASKFIELCKSLEDENLEKSAGIFNCWTSLPRSCWRKKYHILFAFGLTYSCEEIFSHMKAVLRPQRSCLKPKYLNENCKTQK